jgi:hypothetical protein
LTDEDEITDDGDAPRHRLTTDDAQELLAVVRSSLTDFHPPDETLTLGDVRWRPALVASSQLEIVHLHVVDRLGSHWLRRIKAARNGDYTVTVAGPEAVWFTDDTLVDLATADVKPMVIEEKEDGQRALAAYRSVAELIACRNLKLAADAWQAIGNGLFDAAVTETDRYRKGWLFEDFLALLFSQVSYLSLYSHNYHSATEEIDLVLKNHRVSGGSFPSRPVVLVSAKNEPATGRPAFTDFEPKISNRRGQCELGFLCTSGRFASTVFAEALRASRGTSVIVLVDQKAIRQLLASPSRLDEEIERLYYEATLR